MKILRYTIIAVAYLTVVLSHPTFHRRMFSLAKIITCFTTAFFTGNWTPECAEDAKIDVGIVKKMDFADWDINFTGSGIVIASSSLAGTLVSVPNFPWPVTKLSAHCTILDNGNEIASFDVPFETATSNDTPQGTLVSRQFSQVQLIIPAGKEDGFSDFIASLITEPNYKFAIKGYSDATLSTSIKSPVPFPISFFPKSFDVRSVGFSGDVTFKGGNNFPSIKYERQISFTLDSTKGECTLQFEVTINNPSQLIVQFGSVSLNTIDNTSNMDQVIGKTVIKDLSLAREDNKITMTTTSNKMEVCNKLTQTGYKFTLAGFDGTSSNSIVNKALLKLKMQVVIPRCNLLR